ncbi:MAG: CPBP family glutamic-type intramembrane protease, partial [Planctomycetota bacterium]
AYAAFDRHAWFPLPEMRPVGEPGALLWTAATQTLVVAFPEEVFFRAFLQGRLAAVVARPRRLLGANVGWEWPLAAAAFTMTHLPTRGATGLVVFPPALLFGWAFARAGTIWPGVLYHGACNTLAYALAGRA